MNIVLEKIGKKFMHKWIIKQLDLEYKTPGQYGILGNNGSGKSTLLKILSGILTPSEGKISWNFNGKDVSSHIYQYLSVASPHLDLIEEFSLDETLSFHQKFKPFLKGHNVDSLFKISGLSNTNYSKPIKYYSSGMKQRVKLILALMSDTPLVLLDEPCSNFDELSHSWYRNLINDFAGERLLIIASNNKDTECFSCKKFLELSQ